jgi:putative tricarboxylic transport membrane protein
LRRGWLVAAGTFLAVFAGAVYLSSKLPLLDELGFGPGFFPLILALLGAVLALVLVFEVAREPDSPAAADGAGATESLIPDNAAVFRLLGIIVLMLAAFTALDPLGYRLTAFAFVSLLLLVLGVRNYLVIFVVALVFSAGVFHSFYYWLKVPLPIGEYWL